MTGKTDSHDRGDGRREGGGRGRNRGEREAEARRRGRKCERGIEQLRPRRGVARGEGPETGATRGARFIDKAGSSG